MLDETVSVMAPCFKMIQFQIIKLIYGPTSFPPFYQCPDYISHLLEWGRDIQRSTAVTCTPWVHMTEAQRASTALLTKKNADLKSHKVTCPTEKPRSATNYTAEILMATEFQKHLL